MAAQDVHAFGREPHDSATTGAVTQREFLARGRSQHATRGTAANGRSLAGYAQQALSPHCKHTTAQDVHAFRRAPHDSACTGTHHTGCCTPQVAASTRATRHRGRTQGHLLAMHNEHRRHTPSTRPCHTYTRYAERHMVLAPVCQASAVWRGGDCRATCEQGTRQELCAIRAGCTAAPSAQRYPPPPAQPYMA